MSIWTKDRPPIYAPDAILTDKGWEDPNTGEVLVATGQLLEAGADAEIEDITISKVSGTGLDNNYYKTADVFQIQVKFNSAVVVSGTPRISLLGLNVAERFADYHAASSTPDSGILNFRYTVQAADDAAATEVKVAEDGSNAHEGIELNGGTIKNKFGYSHVASVTVDTGGSGYADGEEPLVTFSGGGARQQAEGHGVVVGGAVDSVVIDFAGSFYETVPTVTIADPIGAGVAATGTAVISPTAVDDAKPVDPFPKRVVTAGAISAGGSGYTVAPTVSFSGGLAPGGKHAQATANLNAGAVDSITIDDPGGPYISAPTATFTGGDGTGATAGAVTVLFDGNSLVVDSVAATVATIAKANVAKTHFITGENLDIEITFSKPVVIQGDPTLAITVGGNGRTATYVPPTLPHTLERDLSGQLTHTWRYTIQAADGAQTGSVSVDNNGLALNGGTINNRAGVVSTITHSQEVFTDTSVNDTTAATVSGVTFTGADSSPYFTGETVQISVQFSEVVEVSGAPFVEITLETGVVQAAYTSGDGSNTLVFEYVVQTTDEAQATEFSVAASALKLNGGTIKDGAGNDATLTLNSIADTSAFTVNDVPQVQAAAFSNNSAGGGTATSWLENDVVSLTITFSEPVDVDTGGGTPDIDSIALDVGSLTFVYVSGSGTNQLVFQETIPNAATAQDDGTPDFDLVNGITLNAGTIQDDEETPNNANVATVDWSTLVDMTGITVN